MTTMKLIFFIQNIIMLYIPDIIEDACCFHIPIRYNSYCMFQLADNRFYKKLN
jgi:hypothetical protein